MDVTLTKEIIQDQRLNKLNRLKKVNAEAFFYSRRLEEVKRHYPGCRGYAPFHCPSFLREGSAADGGLGSACGTEGNLVPEGRNIRSIR